MMMRRKTLRRLTIIFLVLAVAASASVYLVANQRKQSRERLAVERKVGMAAYLASDYAKAIDPLDRYTRARPNDSVAAVAYAIARSQVETPNNQHIRLAVQKLDQVLARDPDHLPAKHALLDLYPQTSNVDALLALADDVLAKHPGDESALRGRINAMLRLQRYDDALVTARQYAQRRPNDLQAHVHLLYLMQRAAVPAGDIVAYAQAQLDAHPGDPHFFLLMAVAVNHAGDQKQARELLHQATLKPITDPALVRRLAYLFDQLREFDESRRILEQTAQSTGDPEILRILITRLWQKGEIAEIDRRLASLDQNLPTANTELLALRTMALYQLSRPDEARRCLQHLRDRQDDRKAAAWALSLEAKFESAGQPASVVLDKLTSAITRDADNGITRAWAAEQYWQLGEMSLALRHWNTASLLMGSWSQPFIGISQALMQMGQPADAIKAAQSAFDRSPDLAAAINLAVVRYNASEAGSDAQRTGDAPLRELVSRVQQIQPGEPRTLPIHVALLAASGDTAGATAALDGVISTAASTDAATLLRLAMVSRTYALDRHDALIECTPSDGVTASLALARAQALADQGRPDAGRALMQPTPPPVDGLTWELARATYLESIQDPSAAALWKSLGDAHPQSLEVQRTLLATAASVRGDRPFVLQSIDRLRNLTGESGQQWKLERARWLIESPNVMRDSVEAATLLKEIAADAPRQITPRLQLARALERMGNTASAIEHLREAQNLEPRSVAVGLELVRLLQQKGQIDSVRSVLKRIVEDGQINPVQRVRVAAMFAEINEGESAIALLKAAKPNTLPASGNLLLAELHRRAGQSDEAQAVYDALLAVERPAASVMASAAEFYATRGQFDQARKVLSRMSEGSATAAESAIAWGRFEERFATPSAAEAHYRRAAAAQSEAGHLALIDYLLRRRDFTQAIAACRDAVAKLPTSTALASRLLESQALARQTRTPSNLEPLINALSQDPARAAEVEALKAVSEIKNKRLSREQITPRLREVADRFPLFLPLQEQVIERYLQQNKPNEAITVARRTMEALPADASAAQLAVRTMRAARRWSDMRLAAEQWRSRLGGRTLDADTAIAEALVEMKQPAEALKHLEPMRDAITADVRTQPLAAVVLARAMVARGDGAAARDMLAPLLKDAAGRRMWLMIANAGTPSLTEAAAWLDRVAAATPKERWEERWSVASTMVNIARKFDDAATLQRACDVLTAYLDAHPRDGDALLLQAGVYQQLGKSQAAETSLRAVLELKPGQAAAANDLAYLLLSQNRVLDEAETLARRAVEGAPEAGAFHDTLARVLHARGRRDAARISFETALRLEPELVEARVGFARVLYDNGDVAAAQRELRRIENQLKANPAAAKHVQSELSLVREQLSKID